MVFRFPGWTKIGINSRRIAGFTSLLQTYLMRGSLKGFAQLAIGHNQRGDPPPPPWGGHVFMVLTKPLKQPLGLVMHGVPIEKGSHRPLKARGVTGTWSLPRFNFRQGHVSMV